MALISAEFYSKCLGRGTSVYAILPEPGEAGQDRDGRYPVLWLLHGATDDHTVWQRNSSLERYIRGLGLACVMPAADLSFYTNVDGGRYFDYITQELPELCGKLFPISRAPEDNFVAGLSMGGYGAMKAGFMCPAQYAVMGIFSSANFIDMDVQMLPGGPREPLNAVRERVFGSWDLSQVHNTEHDMRWLARQAAESGKKLPKIFSVCGTGDGCYQYAVQDAECFKRLGYDCLFMESPGGHDFYFWDQWLPVFLQWLPLRQRSVK